jgi:putative transposase
VPRARTAMRLLQPLFALFASATDSELAKMVEYLKAENRILRDKLPKRLTVTPRERNRLVKLGSKLGSAIGDLITIVTPRAFRRWLAADRGGKSTAKKPIRKPGRPRTPEDVRKLVLKLASENGWGYARVLGELRKLGIRTVSKTTVANILREAGLDPGPRRGPGTWDEFVRRHAATLWACDSLSVRGATLSGFVDLYLLFFVHVGTRRVIASGVTANPGSAWVAQQARNASMRMAEWGLPATHLLLDHDAKFTREFDAVFRADGVEVKRVGPVAPNLNAYAERWVQSLRQECLDHFVVLGEGHLRHLVREYVEHHNLERPHQGRGNVPLPDAQAADAGEPPTLRFPGGEVRCRERLGGLLKHYHRAAA